MAGPPHAVDRGHSEAVSGEGLEIGHPVDGGIVPSLQNAAVGVPGAVFSDPDVQAEISKITGIDTASLASSAAGGNITESDVEEQLAAAPTLTEDQISQLVDALLPLAQKEPKAKRAKQALLEYKDHRARTECT